MFFKRLIRIIKANSTSGSTGNSTGYDHYAKTEQSENIGSKQSSPPPPVSEEAKYYANLELKEGASFEEIKVAYRKLMKQYHPDKFHSDPERRLVAEAVSSHLNEAYTYFEKKFSSKT